MEELRINCKTNTITMKKMLLYFPILLFVPHTLFPQDDPKVTEVWDPVPEIVAPGNANEAPSDAIPLFDGRNLDEWTNAKGGEADWEVRDGIITVKPGSGSIQTKRTFADCQLHVEWRCPSKIEGEGQGRGNSGVFLQSRYKSKSSTATIILLIPTDRQGRSISRPSL